MSLIKRMRRQDAVYWKKASGANDYGERSFQAPVAIKCRWEVRVTEFLDREGARQASNAVVYVDQEVAPGDVLAPIVLDAVTDAENPLANAGAFAVRGFAKVPNLHNTENLLIAYL